MSFWPPHFPGLESFPLHKHVPGGWRRDVLVTFDHGAEEDHFSDRAPCLSTNPHRSSIAHAPQRGRRAVQT